MISILKNLRAFISPSLEYGHAFLRIGSGWALLSVDLVLVVVVAIDLRSISLLNLDVFHISFIDNIWPNLNFYYALLYVLLALGLIFLLPPLIAAWAFIFRDFRPIKKSFSINAKNVFFGFHYFVAIGFAFFISISGELASLSGAKAVLDPKQGLVFSGFEYTPAYTYLTSWFVIIGLPVILVIARLIGPFIVSGSVSTSDSSPKLGLVEEFKHWFFLADISSDYFPKQKPDLIFVNTASIAPAIKWITKMEERCRKEYQKRVPTSNGAQDYLREKAERSRDFLRGYLFADDFDHVDLRFDFLPGTSRSLEVGLAQIDALHTIIVSPYEHPGQLDVIQWFAELKSGISVEKLEMAPDKLTSDWETQKEWLIALIREKLSQKPQNANGKIAILLSEVHYITGLSLNVREIIESIRPDGTGSNIVFIIDGSQAVGNIANPCRQFISSLHGDDFYYFSAHKWLLSPNTCGVIISERKPTRNWKRSYDLFHKDPPTATIDPGVIFGIYSSLEYLLARDKYLLKRFGEKSKLLKKHFKENIGAAFEIIESLSASMNKSSFIAIRPRAGYKWKESAKSAFWQEISDDAVDLTFIESAHTNSNIWWLRISFPYFLQLHSLKLLIKHLNNRVEAVNQ